jgi:hypothetical protein
MSGNGAASGREKKFWSVSVAWSGQSVSGNGAASDPFMALNSKFKSKECKACCMLNLLIIN